MSTIEHPITVMSDGREVVCDFCGQTWATDLPTPDAAVKLAEAMNTDAGTVIPDSHRVAVIGMCHDNTERVIIPELPPEPEPVGRPLWATTTVWGAVALAWSFGQVPGVLARGLLRLARVAFPLAALVVFLAIVGVNAPGFGPAIVGFLFNTVMVVGVAGLLVFVCVLAFKEFTTRPHASDEDDATVIKPVRAGSHDHHEE